MFICAVTCEFECVCVSRLINRAYDMRFKCFGNTFKKLVASKLLSVELKEVERDTQGLGEIKERQREQRRDCL